MEIRFSGNDKGSASKNLQRFDIARVFVRLDQVASLIVNVDNSVM